MVGPAPTVDTGGVMDRALAAAATVEDPRRAPRLAKTCRVEVATVGASWSGATEDIGPRGCALLTPRASAVGDRLALSISDEALRLPLVVAGEVVWARAARVSRVGVAFDARPGVGPTPATWFDWLAAAHPDMGSRVRAAPRALHPDAWLYPGLPPPSLADLSPGDLHVLARVGDGIRLRALLPTTRERAVFSLLSRRLLALERPAADDALRWRRVHDAASRTAVREALGSADPRPAPPRLPFCPPVLARVAPAAVAPGPSSTPAPSLAADARAAARRRPEAQQLYERGVELLVRGDALSAEALFRRASALAPEDPVLRNVLKRFEAR
jgi:hypothetical protein